MTEELELKLVGRYPKILKDYKGDPQETCMAWGLECEDGWYQLLDTGFQRIQYLCDLFSKHNNSVVQLVAAQIKQKFGDLRFYYDIIGGDDIQRKILTNIVNEIERESANVCEISGARGQKYIKGHWIKTLSKEESNKLGYQEINK